ncbi:hypothetical protein CASFOL_020787 [Castilleja foliolosa]|uniref:Ribosomal protein L34Ae n=1 Tax=Castilleja foliolosa TaxID=1961234 RepID=A0ABD3D1V4_9LAMI
MNKSLQSWSSFWAQSNYAQITLYCKVAHQLFDYLPKPIFRFSSNFWDFVCSLIIKILGFISKYMYRSKYGVVEENGSNCSANHSQKDNKVTSNNSKIVLSSGVSEKENSNEDIAKTEDSVFNSTKCQFISSKDVIQYLEEPKIEKFLVQEMFVGSSEVLFSSDQQNLEKKSVQFDEEPNCLSFRFNLYNHIPETEEIISINNRERDADHKEEVFEEIEKLSSMGSNDFSYEVDFFPFSQFSTVDENQESGYGKNEKIDEALEFEGFSDDEYLEFEPRCDSLTRIISKDEEFKEQNIDFDSYSDSDEEDVLWEHQNLVRQMKTELKNCRIGGLPTISEECESSKMVGDLKPLKIDHKIEYKDVMDEIQKFHKSYLEKMRKLDILNYQTLHAISFLQLKDSEVFTSGKKTATFNLPKKIWPSKAQRIYADPAHKSISDMRRDLELVYVGQLCLSWEILCWLYIKSRELLKPESVGKNQHSSWYNRAADEFQQFQVLLQRFMEDEPFKGLRNQNYVRSRCSIRSLLQVPTIKDDCLKADKEIREEHDAISLQFLAETIRESMMIFRDFVFSDKKATNVVVNGIHGTKIDLQDLQNSELLVDIISDLQKKDRKKREHVKSRNCIVKKLKKYQSSRPDDDNIELLRTQTDLRLVSRVLSMSRLTIDQLVWCQDKLNNISFVSRKVYVEPSFLLFPC